LRGTDASLEKILWVCVVSAPCSGVWTVFLRARLVVGPLWLTGLSILTMGVYLRLHTTDYGASNAVSAHLCPADTLYFVSI